jgi:hypothetical protein
MLEKNANETVQSAQTFTPFDDQVWERALEMDKLERLYHRKIHREISEESDRIVITSDRGEEIAYLQKDASSKTFTLIMNAGDYEYRDVVDHAAVTLGIIMDETHPFWMNSWDGSRQIAILEDGSRLCVEDGGEDLKVGEKYVVETRDGSVVCVEFDPDKPTDWDERSDVWGRVICEIPNSLSIMHKH